MYFGIKKPITMKSFVVNFVSEVDFRILTGSYRWSTNKSQSILLIRTSFYILSIMLCYKFHLYSAMLDIMLMLLRNKG